MKQTYIIVTLLTLVLCSSIFAKDLALEQEAQKYKTLESLCIKSKEWSILSLMIIWSADKNRCVFTQNPLTQNAAKRYAALAPYVFANLHPKNNFFQLDGFIDYSYDVSKDGKYTISLHNRDITENELHRIIKDFNTKYTRVGFKTTKKLRNLENPQTAACIAEDIINTSQPKLAQKRIETRISETITYKNDKDTIIFKTDTKTSDIETIISVSITYSTK
ncbi:hypothetical protein JHD49_04260 [Sulfurimonas sp. SAG-AH-194-C21]|nr:hypothetical protein [Sulfurimonas sp. SAG-AH-194-C21]MDF1883145.1 hypothetical protein [Sulfurimonas sp. SAG-AH-194-C21]